MVTADETNERRSRGGILLAILALLVGLVAGGGVGILGVGPMLAQRMTANQLSALGVDTSTAKGAEPQYLPLPPTAPGEIFELENLIVNPAGSQGTRFLVVSLALEVDSQAVTLLEEREAAVRDAILHLLGGKTVTELSDISRRDTLKDEMIELLHGVIRYPGIRYVYLPQFVIQ